MEDQGNQPADPRTIWTDNDVFHARRRFSQWSLAFGATVGLAILLYHVASYLAARPPGQPSLLTPPQIEFLKMLSMVPGVLAIFLGIATIGAWLNYVQRRGRRAPERDDPI